MRRAVINFWMFFFPLLGVGWFSCDTVRNLEDPDLQYFIKYFGGDGNQIGVDMVALNDGTFLLLGNSENPERSDDADNSDIYLVKVNAEGDIFWEKRYHKDIARAKDIEPTFDGNFIILADIQESIGAQVQGKLIKVSPDGVMLDSVVFGTIANDYSMSVTANPDGGFFVSGTTELTGTWGNADNPANDLGDFVNRRFDSNLNEITAVEEWSPVSPGTGGKQDVAVKILPSANGYVVFGYSNENLNNTNKAEKLGLVYFGRNATGTAGNTFSPGDVQNDTEIKYVTEEAAELGSAFLVVGSSRHPAGISNTFFARLRNPVVFRSEDDRTLYGPLINISSNTRGVSVTSSLFGPRGYIVIANEVRSTGATNIYVVKIDQSATPLWTATFGSEAEDDTSAAVVELPDGKILILGTMGLADNQSKMALIKVNPNGQLLK